MRTIAFGLAVLSASVSAQEFSFLLDDDTDLIPDDYPEFIIDFDKPPSERYKAVFEHFREPLLDMEDYWYNDWYPDYYIDFFRDNLDAIKEAQPDMFGFGQALADYLDLDVLQTVTVSSITEVSTWCTSIVARDTEGRIAHARNLDFKNTDTMKKLVHMAIIYKDGEEKGRGPLIAGFYGMYTARKDDAYSITFNARESPGGNNYDNIMSNLQRNLDPAYVTQAWLMQDILINESSYDKVQERLSNDKITAAAHFTLGGLQGNQGIVISRDPEGVAHTYELSEDNWYVAITNQDVWAVDDVRYQNTVKFMDAMGQDKVTLDGSNIIRDVLWQKGVIQDDSIFTSTQSATTTDPSFSEILVYDAPNEIAINDMIEREAQDMAKKIWKGMAYNIPRIF